MSDSETRQDKYNRDREQFEKKYNLADEAHIIIHLLELLDKGTTKLNRLTIALISLTVILAILTGVLVYKTICG